MYVLCINKIIKNLFSFFDGLTRLNGQLIFGGLSSVVVVNAIIIITIKNNKVIISRG